MRPNIIQFVEKRRHLRLVDRNEAYSFRKDRPFHFLQRVCLWVLRKIKAHAQTEISYYTRHTIDTRNFVECLLRQTRHLEADHHQKPRRLLIGAETFQRMVGGQEVQNLMNFRCEYEARNGYAPHILGLEVTVVPWMRGLLVMP